MRSAAAREADIDTRVVGHKAVHLPGQVVLDMARSKQHAGYRQYLPRTGGAQLGQPVADRGASEFEVPGGKIEIRQTGAHRSGDQLKLGDRFRITAAVPADQHRRLCHCLYLPVSRRHLNT